jgi:hypothetical protein
MRHSAQITLRGLDPRLEREIQAIARREGVSLNKAALRLMARGAGIDQSALPDQIGGSLDAFIGTWTDREARTFTESVQSCDQIDPGLWA